jgi:hypothetical protein
MALHDFHPTEIDLGDGIGTAWWKCLIEIDVGRIGDDKPITIDFTTIYVKVAIGSDTFIAQHQLCVSIAWFKGERAEWQ